MHCDPKLLGQKYPEVLLGRMSAATFVSNAERGGGRRSSEAEELFSSEPADAGKVVTAGTGSVVFASPPAMVRL